MPDLSQYRWTSFGSAPIEHVEADIRQGGVKDERIIQATLLFHPGDFRPWEILPRPAIVAGIAEALQPTADSNVLDIGTGTGYLTAVLAALSKVSGW
jgi:methylase of polypeptide subunit release factors